ncbi:MAG: flavin monoamine oxidase family protein [Miltoncostaeaceae bacterium]
MRPDVDVAIVGGGMAGLYTGWSLLARGTPVPGGEGGTRVTILESGARTGGRLMTIPPPHAPHLRAELGGMRFLTTQALVADLIDHLGLPHHVFPMGDDHDLHYLRGARFPLSALESGDPVVPYDLADDERGATIAQLMGRVLLGFLPDARTMTWDDRIERERNAMLGNRPVAEASLADVMRRFLSPEAYEMAQDGLGYSCSRDPEVSAVNMIHTDLSGGVHRTLDAGMQALPDALAAAFRAAGGTIATGVAGVGVERAEDDLLRVSTASDGRRGELTARHVVLALPRRALDLMDLGGGVLGETSLRDDLDAVVPVPASKLYFTFDEPWWEEIGLHTGRSVTDLPMRQCLYFGVEDEASGGARGNRTALFVASYNDDGAARHWEAKRAEGGEPFQGRHPTAPQWSVPAPMAEDVARQVSEVHGVPIPDPTWAAYQDWGRDPYGAGWHYWRVGHRSVDVIPRMRRPHPDANLSVCGEAFSAHQGWILGALSSSEHVLRESLGQPPASWIADDVELGP